MRPLHQEDVISPYNHSGELNEQGMTLYKKGQEILRSSKCLGLVILSGGEGTRLGLKYPKGLFEIEGRTLFEWHLSRVEELHHKYGTKVRLFIMTSESTHGPVSEYFSSKQYSFLESVDVFKQNSIEAISIADRSPIKLGTDVVSSPMGNGDFYEAIRKVPSRSGVDVFNVISVDNVLAHVFDEVFVGAFFSSELDILSKAVLAKDGENVGAFIQDGAHIKIREYSESPGDAGRSPLGNICNHMFSASFVEMMGDKELPLHEARKKIPYTDESGKIVSPSSPNGIKREKFIFDSFAYSTKNQVLCVPREHEFSPLKNSLEASSDNMQTCSEAVKNFRLRSRSLFSK